jgi:hypothetical protein
MQRLETGKGAGILALREIRKQVRIIHGCNFSVRIQTFVGFKFTMKLHLTRFVLNRFVLLGMILGCIQPHLVKAVDLVWNPAGTTYETYLSTTVVEGRKVNPPSDFDIWNYVSYTNHQFSYTPLTSSISNSGWYRSSTSPIGYARGTAEVQGLNLHVYSDAYSNDDHAHAAAVSVTTFSSPIDQMVPFEIRASGVRVHYTEGFISLLDVTTDQPLWYQHWGYWGANTIRGFGASRPEPFLSYQHANRLEFSYPIAITLTQETQLFRDHEYRLVMYAQGNANADSEAIHLSIIVPEPSLLSLVGLGALLPILRRGRRNSDTVLCRYSRRNA